MKRHKKQRFCRMMCKNAAENIEKFAIFDNYRIISLCIEFINIVILIYQFEIKRIINSWTI